MLRVVTDLMMRNVVRSAIKTDITRKHEALLSKNVKLLGAFAIKHCYMDLQK